MIGQLVRRMNREVALKVAEDFFSEINFVDDSELHDVAFSIAVETGSRAIDSFYISAAKMKEALLVSNDKLQLESAQHCGVEAYSLLNEFEKVEAWIRSRA